MPGPGRHRSGWTAVTVTHAIPAADSGLYVTDYTTAFTVTTHLVSDGAVTILLGEDPVLLEEAEGERAYLPLVLRCPDAVGSASKIDSTL